MALKLTFIDSRKNILNSFSNFKTDTVVYKTF